MLDVKSYSFLNQGGYSMSDWSGSQEEKSFLFKENGEAERSIVYHQQKYKGSLVQILNQLPILRTPTHRLNLAKTVNFILNGSNFEVIENPEEFKETAELTSLAMSQSVMEGEYDLTQIDLPKFSENTLTFFVHQEGTPYKVTVSKLFSMETPHASYELLPFKK